MSFFTYIKILQKYRNFFDFRGNKNLMKFLSKMCTFIVLEGLSDKVECGKLSLFSVGVLLFLRSNFRQISIGNDLMAHFDWNLFDL